MSSSVILAAGCTALAVAMVLRVVAPPPRRLRGRVEPYLSPTRVKIDEGRPSGALQSVFGPMMRDTANWVGARLDRTGTGVTLVRIRQSGLFTGSTDQEMTAAYRMSQLKSVLAATALALAVGQLLGAAPVVRLALLSLGLVFGATRPRGRLDKAIGARQERMKVEIYTVNQLLAMRIRAGGGVIQAVRAIIDRGQGDVVSELSEAARLHRSGWRAPDAFRRIAELSPEPFCARTYRLLAAAEERGADLASALLALSEDVRETRRESIKRTATKRRAAMLVPTIAILAPVLILFVAAPLPYLITGWQ